MFAKIGSYPLMNPHDGYEGILLAHGSKPVGLLVPPEGPGDPVNEPDFITQIRAQVVIADAAVAAGLILKTTVVVPPSSRYRKDEAMIGHIYAQPAYRAEMMEMADCMQRLWTGDESQILSKDSGHFFGYSERDIELCGQFDRLNPVKRFALEKTNSIRRYCRMQAVLSAPPARKP